MYCTNNVEQQIRNVCFDVRFETEFLNYSEQLELVNMQTDISVARFAAAASISAR